MVDLGQRNKMHASVSCFKALTDCSCQTLPKAACCGKTAQVFIALRSPIQLTSRAAPTQFQSIPSPFPAHSQPVNIASDLTVARAASSPTGRTSPARPHFRSDLVRWQQLVTPAWLADLLIGRPVVAAPARAWCLLEVGCEGFEAFAKAHVPGASYLDTHQLEGGAFWNKVGDADLLGVLLKRGIRHDTTVSLYGQNSIAGARAAHLMLYAGVRDVRLLEGGLASWREAGLPLQAGPGALRLAASHFGADFPGCPHYLVGTAEVQSLLLQPNAAVVSIRTLDEFSGKTSGYS